MRVLLISSLWPPSVLGGAEQYAAGLSDALRQRGHTVGVVTLGVEGPEVVDDLRAWPYPLPEYGTQPAGKRALFHLRDLYNPSTTSTLTRAVSSFAPDVVHSHAVQGMSALALSVPGRLGVPHVHTIHDYWLLCQRASMSTRSGHVCERRCRPCAAISWTRSSVIRRHPPQVVIAVSEAVARAHDDVDWLRGRLRVVRNPVAGTAPAGAGATHDARAVHDPLTFGFLGRLVPTKGVQTLIAAFRRAGLERARMRVAGDGPLAESVRTAGSGVEYLGWVASVRKSEFLESLDCLVVPSEWRDPAPLVVDEAAASRLPVIGARVGGIPELVPRACEPLLFRAGDATELADRMRRFAADPVAYAPEPTDPAQHGWDPHLRALCAAYEDAVAANR